MEIVGPQRVEIPTAFRFRLDHARQVAHVFGNHRHLPSGAFQRSVHGRRDGRQDVAMAVVHDGVRCVEPQAVEMIFVNPAQRVLDHVVAHRFAMRPVEIDSGAPGAVVGFRIVIRTEGGLIRAVRSQVVVDDIQIDRDAQTMRVIDEAAQIVRRSIAARGSERRDAVVAPVPAAREIGDRHEFHRGYAEVLQDRKALRRRCECALRRERADVQLIKNRCLRERGRSRPDRSRENAANPRSRTGREHPAAEIAMPDRETARVRRRDSDIDRRRQRPATWLHRILLRPDVIACTRRVAPGRFDHDLHAS